MVGDHDGGGGNGNYYREEKRGGRGGGDGGRGRDANLECLQRVNARGTLSIGYAASPHNHPMKKPYTDKKMKFGKAY